MHEIQLPNEDFIFFPSGDTNVPSGVPNIPTLTDSTGPGQPLNRIWANLFSYLSYTLSD